MELSGYGVERICEDLREEKLWSKIYKIFWKKKKDQGKKKWVLKNCILTNFFLRNFSHRLLSKLEQLGSLNNVFPWKFLWKEERAAEVYLHPVTGW